MECLVGDELYFLPVAAAARLETMLRDFIKAFAAEYEATSLARIGEAS